MLRVVLSGAMKCSLLSTGALNEDLKLFLVTSDLIFSGSVVAATANDLSPIALGV